MKVFGKKQVRGKRPEARKMSDRKVEKEKYEKSSEKVLQNASTLKTYSRRKCKLRHAVF